MPPRGRVYAVGGGTRNEVWMQATSDLGQVPQVVRERTVGASYGDAFLAAVAVGAATPGQIVGVEPGRAHRDTRARAGLRPAVPAVEGALRPDEGHRARAGARRMTLRAAAAELADVAARMDDAALEPAVRGHRRRPPRDAVRLRARRADDAGAGDATPSSWPDRVHAG